MKRGGSRRCEGWNLLITGKFNDSTGALILKVTVFCLCFSSPAGQHDCVTVINNFFSRARLDYYTKAQGLEKEPKLPTKLAGPLHKVIMSTNLNPVKVEFDVYS